MIPSTDSVSYPSRLPTACGTVEWTFPAAAVAPPGAALFNASAFLSATATHAATSGGPRLGAFYDQDPGQGGVVRVRFRPDKAGQYTAVFSGPVL
eukprot:gene1633-2859_t